MQAVSRTLLHRCESPEAQGLIKELICVCPNCDEPPLATCECDFAQKQRGYIEGALALGFSKEEIVDTLVGKFGTKVLATPPPPKG